MEPQIQYVKTSDGVNIAYHAIGQGQPFVAMDMPYTHLQFEWRQDESSGAVLHTIASVARLVRYDHRGFGLSDRTPKDYSLDAFVVDLETVVDKLDLPSFILYAGRGPTTPIAVAYAARHPERVASLVLYNAAARMPEPMHQQLENLIRLGGDWRFVSEGVSRLVHGWDEDSASQALAEFLRISVDLDGFSRWVEAYASWDVRSLLPDVRTRTLLTSMLGHAWFGEEYAREMAADMPDARCFINDGQTSAERDTRTFAAVSEFLGGPAQAPAAQSSVPSGTAIILFADIADSTALTERLGDAAFRDKARSLDTALRTAITLNGGTAIDGKLLGDGVLATFGAAREAIACAQACHAAAQGVDSALHVGIHAGDVIRERAPDGRVNVYGGAVNIAARVASESAAGETLVSDIVRGLAKTSAGVEFEDRGERELKGVGEPVRVYEVRWRE